MMRFGEFELDDGVHPLRRAGEPIAIQAKACALLRYLIDNRDRLISRTELLEKLWSGVTVNEGVLSRAIYVARRAVGDDGKTQRVIRTVRGRGVGFVAPVADTSSDSARSSKPALLKDRNGALADLTSSLERLRTAIRHVLLELSSLEPPRGTETAPRDLRHSGHTTAPGAARSDLRHHS